jgi:uncharacterized membrane protein SpoIIM required for sporulation/uncharacterized RDD family membrane protein YckC
VELRQRHEVETPEHVELRLELAGVGSRTAAAALDTLLITALLLVAEIVGGYMSTIDSVAASWATALLILLFGFALILYYILLEGLWGGRTLGKRALGIRVVMDTGRALTMSAAVVRNLLRILDFLFPLAPLAPGIVLAFVTKSHKRLGDMVAGTIVVRDRPIEHALATMGAGAAEAPFPEADAGPPDLTEAEFRLLDRFLARLSDLAPEAQTRLTIELARRFEPKVPRRTASAERYLLELFAEEQRKRRGPFAPRARAGAAGRTAVPAERLVARKRESWEAFRALATRVERAGVGTLVAGEVPAFAARYREVAADLARARTYAVDPRVIEYLERLVGAGHNALYRSRGRHRPPMWRYVVGEFPAAVVASWRYVLVAFLLFAAPAVVGYAVARERPEVIEEVMPVMVSRAQQAADREARGLTYAQADPETRPPIAAWIIQNNIWVCFLAFAGGLLGGLVTAYSLVFNGLGLGMAFGVFTNYHAAAYLTTFVAGHGVLELSAIFISGGAGLRLARALIAPGDRLRRDALVIEGAVAVRMIGAVVCLLILAGTIEGLLSTSDAPATWKFGVSGASAVLLALYLMRGWQVRRSATTSGAAGAAAASGATPGAAAAAAPATTSAALG